MKTTQRGLLPLWLIIFMLAAAVFAGGVVFVANRSSVPSPFVIPRHTLMPSAIPVPTATPSLATPTPVPTAAAIPSDARLNSYPSPDDRFAFDVYDVGTESNQCPFRVEDGGREIDGARLLGLATVDCWSGMGFDSAFKGWVDGDRFLIRRAGNDIMIVDPAQSSVRDYKVDSSLLFRGASHSLKYWLFQKDPDAFYTLFDWNADPVVPNIDNKYDRGVLYDTANDGFLFMGRDYNGTNESVRLDFLSLKDLTLKTVLTTDPVKAPEHGCGSESLSSKPGEIILSPGCLTFDKKYVGPDGMVHVRL